VKDAAQLESPGGEVTTWAGPAKVLDTNEALEVPAWRSATMTEVILRTRNRHGLSAGAAGTLNVPAKTKVRTWP
jgi:hypothetical protein